MSWSVAKVIGFGAVGLLIGGGVWMYRLQRCEAECQATLREARGIAAEGRLVEAIGVLDRVDARCNCMQFTEGDEPTEHAAMRTWVSRICAEEGKIEMDAENAGPMLEGLLKHAPCR